MRIPQRLPLTPYLLALGMLGGMGTPTAAGAQALVVKVLCTNHGSTAPEPTGEAEGHSLLVAQATCLVQGGPLDGAIETQQNLWRYERGTGTLLSGHAVTRKPGALGAAQVTQGSLVFQMTDGRVTGWTATGRGRVTLAVGAAASLAGRSLSWTAAPTGPRSYTIQVSYEP